MGNYEKYEKEIQFEDSVLNEYPFFKRIITRPIRHSLKLKWILKKRRVATQVGTQVLAAEEIKLTSL